ncbi:HAD-IA family hydrolase [Allomesorhizobium camelthorni]|uniref:HAD-IA family hydrolase n=1 Tax=Allomesorhizobium camelthorni TaxID=475069 RepID=A0A6G4WJN9_9HYPH|nr:HAD-IA family hydrolase [Mesorhizobium camelthorni]NGO55015.1 HAD-IA family hydrolase [Mesorhizobium camelthorni]
MSSGTAQALVLDFGGVMTKTMFETHAHTEAALGLEAGALAWRGPFAPETDPLWQMMQNDEISERDYWLDRTRQVGQLVGKRWSRMEDFVRQARGADPEAVIRPEAGRAIRAVHGAGFRLAILSNELDLFYGADFCSRLPILDLFETIVDATYTKILKPDPRAYRAVLDALGLPAEACVFVDDQKRNVEGAAAVGMRAVQFDVREPGQSYAEALLHFGLAFT